MLHFQLWWNRSNAPSQCAPILWRTTDCSVECKAQNSSSLHRQNSSSLHYEKFNLLRNYLSQNYVDIYLWLPKAFAGAILENSVHTWYSNNRHYRQSEWSLMTWTWNEIVLGGSKHQRKISVMSASLQLVIRSAVGRKRRFRNWLLVTHPIDPPLINENL